MQFGNKDKANILNNVKTMWRNVVSCYFVTQVMQFSAQTHLLSPQHQPANAEAPRNSKIAITDQLWLFVDIHTA